MRPCIQMWAVPITTITACDRLCCNCEVGLNKDHPNGNKRSLCVRLLAWGSWKRVNWKRIDHITWWFMGTYLFFLVDGQLEVGTKWKEASYLWSSPDNWALTSAARNCGVAPWLLAAETEGLEFRCYTGSSTVCLQGQPLNELMAWNVKWANQRRKDTISGYTSVTRKSVGTE